MHKNITIIVGITILFLGVGIQPAIAQPDIIDFKPENIDKEELTAKIDEIMEKYGHIPMVSYYSSLIGFMGLFGLYVLLHFVAILFWTIVIFGYMYIYNPVP